MKIVYQLIKKDFQIHGWITIIFFILFPFTFLFNNEIIVYFLLFWFHGLFALLVFNKDDEYNVNQFYLSLPILKAHLVISKYMFLLSNALIIMLYQWGIFILIKNQLSNRTFHLLGLEVIIPSLAISLILLLILLQLYYLLPTYVNRLVIFVIPFIYLVGILFQSKIALYFESIQAASIFLLIALFIFVLSMLFSIRIFSKKDVVV